MLAIITGKISLFFTQLPIIRHLFARSPASDSHICKPIYFRTYYDICRQAFSLIVTSIFSLMLLCQFLCSCSEERYEQLGKKQYERDTNSNKIDNEIDDGIICRISDWNQTTKVELGNWEAVSSCPVLWNSGDRIAILCNDGTRSSYVTESDKTQKARFRYDDNLSNNNRLSISERYLALYPDEAWDTDGTILIPSTQTFEPTSGNGLFFPMVAIDSSTRSLEFSGICGILRLKCLTSSGTATSETESETETGTEASKTDCLVTDRAETAVNGSATDIASHIASYNVKPTGVATDVTVKEVSICAKQDIGNVKLNYSDYLDDYALAKAVNSDYNRSANAYDTINTALKFANAGNAEKYRERIMLSDNAAATNVIQLELPGETTLSKDGTDFLFTVKPGEYDGVKFQLRLSDGRFLIYPVPDCITISKNVMTTYTIPIEAFFLSDKSTQELGLADKNLISLDYTLSLSDIETEGTSESDTTQESVSTLGIEDTSEVDSTPGIVNTSETASTPETEGSLRIKGASETDSTLATDNTPKNEFTVNSYRSYTFSDGTQWLSDVDMDASFSTDGGITFSNSIPSILAEFSINNTFSSLSSKARAATNSCSRNNTSVGSRSTTDKLTFKKADIQSSTWERHKNVKRTKLGSFSEDDGTTVSGQSGQSGQSAQTGLYEITYTLSEEADSCVVRLTQRVSGKNITVTLR